MSRDSYSASARRSRVSSFGLPLTQLDSLSLNSSNMMPQPSSTLKRIGPHRQSIAPASARASMIPSARTSMLPSTSNPRASMLPGGRPTALSTTSKSRHSMIPSRGGPYSRNAPITSGPSAGELMAASAQRSNMRKSIVPSQGGPPGSNTRSRQSSMGIGNFSTPIGGTTSSKDTRPLRDRNYQAVMCQAIYDYLLDNKFEIEMRHPLTQKTLKAPTQKDFVYIFHWLYKRLDPGYKFTKSIEHEVYFLLKTINYPFLESINKSQISAVGGQNWPVYLGMLHWLVELNMSLETYDSKDYSTGETDDDMLDQIFIRYISKSYKAFLANEDDYSEYKQEMEHEFEQYSASLSNDIESAANETAALESRFQELNKASEHYSSLERKGEALESDLVKFKAYIDTMEKRKAKWTSVLEKIGEELESAVRELKEIQTSKNELQQKIKEQGLLPADIDRINSERENLGRSLEKVSASLEEMNKICNEKEAAAQSSLDSLERYIQKYTSSIYRIGIVSNENIKVDFDISLDAPLSTENLGKRPDALLKGKNLQQVIRPALLEYRNSVGTKVHIARDDLIKLQDQFDRITESINEKKDQTDNLDAKLNAARISHEAIYETMTSDTSVSHAQIEKMERDLQAMEIAATQGMLQLNQRSQSIAIEFDQLERNVQISRESMHADVQRMLFQITDFKVLIQESLEDFENFVVDEWNDAVSND